MWASQQSGRMTAIKALQRYAQFNAVDLSTQFTLLTLLLAQVGNAFSRPFILMLAAIAILQPGWNRQPWIWSGLFLLTGFRLVYEWPLADNHSYLLTLWSLALALALVRQNDSQMLANNARILIGLLFLLASIQKIISSDYLDGTFFRFLLLADNRFEDFAVLFGNITYRQINNAREILDTLQYSPASIDAQIVPVAPQFHLLVLISTWWNFLDQLAVAACFLAPVSSRLYQSRDAILMIFCISTYLVAPVPGFGWLLVSIALAQSNESSTRIGYFAVFFIILFGYEVPWARMLVDFLELG